jgi:HTH-type transcriptional regulator/antitoxin HigA
MTDKHTNQYRPDFVSPPGETLADLLDERGMSQAELAERTGRPTKTINEIIKGKAAITSDTALQLERVFGVPAEFWNAREAQYRQYLAETAEQDRLKACAAWVKSFPLKEMVEQGWITNIGKDATQQVIQVLNFFGVASPEQWAAGWTKHRLSFRRSAKLQTKLEATSAWLRQGEILCARMNCADFSESLLRDKISELRELTLTEDPNKFVPSLISTCAEFGVAVVFVPPLKGVPVCGAARWISPKKALIQLSLRYKTNDILWFTFFHELAHVLLHKKKDIFVDISGFGSNDSQLEEEEANAFAANTLIPQALFEEWLRNHSHFSRETVVEFAQNIGIAPAVVVGRLQRMKKLLPSNLNDLKTYYSWSQEDSA